MVNIFALEGVSVSQAIKYHFEMGTVHFVFLSTRFCIQFILNFAKC